MSRTDRDRWDERHAAEGPPSFRPDAPPHLADVTHLIPTSGPALELACGRGELGVWLARHGLDYRGVDVSPVAIGLARELAREAGVGDRCRFEVWDLDDGLPPGPPVDLILCHLYLPERLAPAITERLRPGGTLVLVTLSEIGGSPGRFRARPGQLVECFPTLRVLAHQEGDGLARLVALRP